MAYLLSAEQVNELMNLGTPKAEFFRRITQRTLQRIFERLGRPGLFMPDPLAMAAALEPSLVTKSEKRAVTVELNGAHTRGQTSVDWFGFAGRAPTVDVILEINFERFMQMMKAAVA